jgi:two-component system alkaline phosphatase synthesis response regulator PhoP
MKKILVCDDSEYILQLLTAKLKNKNYNVIRASNGTEALKKLESDKPDLLMLDIMMPGMDGVDVIKTIREKEQKDKKSKLPVIILSAQNDMTIKLWFEQHDIHAYLTKPFSDEDLLNSVKTALGE